jgi:tetratricopeptide (TPR) repeat protein
MKRLAVLFLCLSFTFYGYAQKSNIQSAFNYLKYDELDKAKEAIDAAVVYESTANSEKAWYYRGLIYEQIFADTTGKWTKLSPDPMKVAYESYTKALQIAPKGDFTEEINVRLQAVAVGYMKKGIADFGAKKYPEALSAFESALNIIPNDTNIVFNAGLAADRAGDHKKAVTYYSKINEWNPREQKIYALLIDALKASGDTARAMEVIRTGRKNFPDDFNILLAEINIYLAQGKTTELINLLEEAVKKEPTNTSLYFALGNTYDNLSGARNDNDTEIKNEEYLQKAEAAYKKAVELKPDYFDANYSLGALYFNHGAKIYNQAAKIKDNAQFLAAQKKYKEKFAQAQPYFEKALELNPNDSSTLLSLKELYAKTNQLEKSAEMKRRYEALPKK